MPEVRGSTPEKDVSFLLECRDAVKINSSPLFTATICKKYVMRIFFTAFHSISDKKAPPNLDPGISTISDAHSLVEVDESVLLTALGR